MNAMHIIGPALGPDSRIKKISGRDPAREIPVKETLNDSHRVAYRILSFRNYALVCLIPLSIRYFVARRNIPSLFIVEFSL